MLRQIACLAITAGAFLTAQEPAPPQESATPEISSPAPTPHATAANIKHASQSDMLVGTRVPRDLDWSTPSRQERLRVWWRGIAASPGSYIRSTVTSGMNHLSNSPRDYGQGWGAFGQRYGNTFLTYSLQDTVGQSLSASVGYEMRYIQCKCTGFMPRFGHALAWNFVTYNREGKKVFNWPSLVGGYAVGALSTTYTPNQKWSAQGIQAGNSAIYFGFMSSLLQEFSPSKIFGRHKSRKMSLTAPDVPPTPAASPTK
ncbi:MAG: hypothetical protein K2X03_19840 [Bryobacteraceae bacterium]|nr:hypothetical protein [Bryobacteraceae bacterium]